MKEMKTYLFSYGHDGADWSIEIKADSPEDAKARISKLVYARYDGEVVGHFPARSGLLLRLLVGVRNVLHSALGRGGEIRP